MLPKSKYYPLFEYLQQQPDSSLLELSFSEIEKILGLNFSMLKAMICYFTKLKITTLQFIIIRYY
jgi:hypothetical protein